MGNWTFITNHGAVLAFIAKHTRAKAIEIASELGITERSVRRITAHLEAEGYIRKTRVGNSNEYEVGANLPLRRPEIRDIKVGELLKVLLTKVNSSAY